MDSYISLALMTKAKKVFEKEDTFLNFPTTPITAAKEELEFLTNTSAESQNKWFEFSKFVDAIPRGMISEYSADESLSSVFGEILKTMKLAEQNRSADEEKEYESARRYLTLITAEGTVQDSPELTTYNQYKDSYYLALQEFKIRKETAANSTEPNAKKQWEEIDEPLLSDKLSQIETLWKVNGYRDEVENAVHIIRVLGVKSPTASWGEWEGKMTSGVDDRTSVSGEVFYPSLYVPSDALEEKAWQKFPLNGGEIQRLIWDSPEELRRRLVPDPIDLEIESLTFEFSSAKISRPWFSPEVFDARFWKLRDEKLISDGVNLQNGVCPAYITAVVFARNVEFKLKQNSVINAKSLPLLKSKGLSLGMLKLAVKSDSVSVQSPVVSFPVVPLPAKPVRSLLMRNLRVGMFSRFDKADMVKISPVQPVETNPVPEIASVTDEKDNTIYILAFICKKIGFCPNPDPNLFQ